MTAGLQGLKSYRLHMLFTVDAKDRSVNPQQGTLDIVEDIDNAGHSLHARLLTAGNLNSGYGVSGAASETYFLDGTTFLVDSGKCRFLSKKPYSGLAGITVSPDEYFGPIATATLLARAETANLVTADHYTFAAAALGRQLKGMNMTQGDVWVASDGYTVKLGGKGAGTDQYGSVGTVSVSYDVVMINQLTPIKAPADCVAP